MPTVPFGKIVDFIPKDDARGRLTGFCNHCESLCNRFVRIDQIDKVAPNLRVSFPTAQKSLMEEDKALVKTHLPKDD